LHQNSAPGSFPYEKKEGRQSDEQAEDDNSNYFIFLRHTDYKQGSAVPVCESKIGSLEVLLSLKDLLPVKLVNWYDGLIWARFRFERILSWQI